MQLRLVRIHVVGFLVATLAVTAASPAIAGSWRTFHGGPRRTGEVRGPTAIDPSVAAGFRVAWSSRVGELRLSPSAVVAGDRWAFEMHGRGEG